MSDHFLLWWDARPATPWIVCTIKGTQATCAPSPLNILWFDLQQPWSNRLPASSHTAGSLTHCEYILSPSNVRGGGNSFEIVFDRFPIQWSRFLTVYDIPAVVAGTVASLIFDQQSAALVGVTTATTLGILILDLNNLANICYGSSQAHSWTFQRYSRCRNNPRYLLANCCISAPAPQY